VSATAAVVAPRGTLLSRELILGVALAGTSGAAILLHWIGALPVSFTVPFVAAPAAVVLTGAILVGQGRFGRLHAFSRSLLVGMAMGLLATVAYDIIRPPLVFALGGGYDPYRAQPIFGQLITGLPGSDPRALAAGWAYHTWNGLSFGVIYALVRPQGGWRTGLAWGLGLQALMMAVYPALLQARLDDPAFMITGIVGHSFWGIVLGEGVRRAGVRA
jgi:hypothetical protein